MSWERDLVSRIDKLESAITAALDCWANNNEGLLEAMRKLDRLVPPAEEVRLPGCGRCLVPMARFCGSENLCPECAAKGCRHRTPACSKCRAEPPAEGCGCGRSFTFEGLHGDEEVVCMKTADEGGELCPACRPAEGCGEAFGPIGFYYTCRLGNLCLSCSEAGQ